MIGLCADQIRFARRKRCPDKEITVVVADKIVITIAAVIVNSNVCTCRAVRIIFINQNIRIGVRIRCIRLRIC